MNCLVRQMELEMPPEHGKNALLQKILKPMDLKSCLYVVINIFIFESYTLILVYKLLEFLKCKIIKPDILNHSIVDLYSGGLDSSTQYYAYLRVLIY